MCGRFNFGDETEKDIKKIVGDLPPEISQSRSGDIRPSEMATVIIGERGRLAARNMRWGFPSYLSKQLIINARAETVLEKKSFSDSVLKRRCIIAAKHFYEWDRSKNKVIFTCAEASTLYIAGFYRCFDDGDRFVILTTEANASMRPVHPRMPLILKESQLKEWICDERMVKVFLRQGSPMLTGNREYEQLTLF